ncbi:type II secretion system F family protein [bacterium]|nr:type II secretion system F family protein [bacterium]
MPMFRYEAVDANGNLVRGTLQADSESQVIERLARENRRVIYVAQEEEIKRKGFSLKFGGVSDRDLLVFTRQFATLLRAGVPIIRSLDSLKAQTLNPILKDIIQQVRNDVMGGMSLADALARHPKIFSSLYVNMVRVAEATGNMGDVLQKIANFIDNEMTIKGRIKGALVYPAFVLTVAIVVLIVLFFFVMPTFKGLFSEMGAELPTITKIAMALTDWLLHWWFAIPLFLIGVFLFYYVYSKLPTGRYQIDLLKLRLPLFGPLVQKMALSRFARTFATLLSAGVPILRSLEIVRDVVGNSVFAAALTVIRENVRDGYKLSAPMMNYDIFPPLVVQMVDTGEEAGNLPEMVEQVALFYDEEVDRSIKALLSLLEPLIIVFLAVVGGFVAASVYLPLFKMATIIR